MYIFPRTVFVGEKTIQEQVKHVADEVGEVFAEFNRPPVKYDQVAAELMDVIHSAETALRILQETRGVDIEAAREATERKNRVRNYYSE